MIDESAIERTWKTKSWEIRLLQIVMGMTLVNVYLAFKYIADKEMNLREFTNSITLAMCGRRWEGLSRRRHAAHGRQPSMHRWLEVILMTFPTPYSTGERLALAEAGKKDSVRRASTSMHQECASRP